jgi:hypothetical protein
VIVTRLIPAVVFVAIFVAHALYVGACAASAPSGWTDFGISAHAGGPPGLGAYWRGQDYFIGFSYALAAAFAAWALSRSILFRQGRIVTVGAAAGGVTLLGALMAGGCFLIGCCGSPMLVVYLSLFGAKALGLGRPLMALVTLISVSCGTGAFREISRGETLAWTIAALQQELYRKVARTGRIKVGKATQKSLEIYQHLSLDAIGQAYEMSRESASNGHPTMPEITGL